MLEAEVVVDLEVLVGEVVGDKVLVVVEAWKLQETLKGSIFLKLILFIQKHWHANLIM